MYPNRQKKDKHVKMQVMFKNKEDGSINTFKDLSKVINYCNKKYGSSTIPKAVGHNRWDLFSSTTHKFLGEVVSLSLLKKVRG